ncbi:hypothetical protein I2F27_03665 [Acinetobacter sp. B5B]|uniref:hypothetical protein n=1 Tax=Acinetobacter baretiae TaxID=2605383 RepID=UPI0018C2B30A|nr:hypothetical protein [Acinetobacter baretiae]MBF7682429.1 hypothetical protein [Acinetobacter baretiae]MBF7685303.1 hypothetical protein [Acinetobacter baretiae]
MKLHFCPKKQQILIQQKKGDRIHEHDVTYDSLLLTGAFISMCHDGAVTIHGQDGEPIFDIEVKYHPKKKDAE